MGLFNKKKTPVDVLQEKRKELVAYEIEYENAVSIVNNTVCSLEKISENIQMKIKEIDEYQEELSKTRTGLDTARERNEKVIKNFKSLLCVD